MSCSAVQAPCYVKGILSPSHFGGLFNLLGFTIFSVPNVGSEVGSVGCASADCTWDFDFSALDFAILFFFSFYLSISLS